MNPLPADSFANEAMPGVLLTLGLLAAGVVVWVVGCWYDDRRKTALLKHSCPCSNDVIRLRKERDDAHLHIAQQQMLCDLHHRTLAKENR